MPPQKSVCLFMNNGLLYEHNFMKDGFLGFAGMGSRTGLLPPLSERLTHAIKRLADQHRGLFLADPLVGTLRAPRRLPGEETRLPLASGRLAVIIQGTWQCSFGQVPWMITARRPEARGSLVSSPGKRLGARSVPTSGSARNNPRCWSARRLIAWVRRSLKGGSRPVRDPIPAKPRKPSFIKLCS